MASGKVALVTGGGRRRVGWHVAEALAKADYNVAIQYRTSGTEAAETVRYLKSLGIQSAGFAADISDEKSVDKMVRDVKSRFGQIDVLVCTAAAWKSTPLENVTAADVRGYLEVNTLGTFLCCQHVGMLMVDQPEGGSIVTVGDWACARPYVNYSAYFPSKGAIPTLTRMFAVELAARNPRIRVNCILPGPVLLPPDLPERERQQSINGTLVKREGSPKNIAQAVLHFVENDFVTGACLPVDGGRSIYAPDSEI